MDELLTSIDQKLSIVLYCLVGFLVLSAVRTFFQIRSSARAKRLDAEAEYYVNLFRKEKYSALIQHADASLKDDSKDLYATWYKAKTLYQLARIAEARELFDHVRTIEPDWTDIAQTYIRRIDEILKSAARDQADTSL